MTYLGEVLGYNPTSAAERARADCITQNALDFISSGRSSFHPVKSTMSYNDQKEEGDRVSKEWCGARGATFLQYFEKILKQARPAPDQPVGPVARGENITYADFCLYHVLEAFRTQFDKEFYGMAWTNMDIPTCKQFHTQMHERPNLVAYRQTDRCPPFAGDSMM